MSLLPGECCLAAFPLIRRALSEILAEVMSRWARRGCQLYEIPCTPVSASITHSSSPRISRQHLAIDLDPDSRPVRHAHHAVLHLDRAVDQILAERMRRLVELEHRLD